MLYRILEPSFIKFAVVGALGFFIDGGVLTLLMGMDWHIIASRACSFSAAVTATWMANRVWTFKSGGPRAMHREYTYYFTTQIAGAIINLSVFLLIIHLYPWLRSLPLIPLAFGSAVAMAFNFLVLKNFVYL